MPGSVANVPKAKLLSDGGVSIRLRNYGMEMQANDSEALIEELQVWGLCARLATSPRKREDESGSYGVAFHIRYPTLMG